MFQRLAGNLSRARLHDRHAERAAAARQVTVRLRRRRPARWRTGDGPQRRGEGAEQAAAGRAAPRSSRRRCSPSRSVRDDVPLLRRSRATSRRLSHEAQAADQPGLAAAVLKAQEAFDSGPQDESRQGRPTARGELSEALVDFVATSTEPAGMEPVSRRRERRSTPMKPIVLIHGDLEHDEEMREVFLEEARRGDHGCPRGMRPASCTHSPGDLGAAHHHPARLPYPQGQLRAWSA